MNPINRRQFLTHSAAVAAAATLPGESLAKTSIRARRIPGTDEYLPVVGLGAPNFFYTTPPEGDQPAKAVIRAMVEMGGTIIDTPPFFRPDPPVVGRLINEMGLQDKLFFTGKITVSGKQEGIAHLEQTVKNLNKRPMDLLMVHNMRDMANHWPTLKEWKETGKVRYIGVSLTRTTDYSGLERFMNAERPDFIMIRYSIHHPITGERILPLAAEIGTAVIGIEAFKTDDDGRLFSLVAGRKLPEWASEFDCETWAQFSLKFMLANPAVTCVLTETSKVHHIVDNMRAGLGRLPDEATRDRMSEYLLSLS
ncbi:MAG: aldo/keto reductase [Woeseiaceae bacterium]